ncbi:MAG: hypothetical protein QOE40_2613 [Actinomycetota bacterium]|jgi:nitroreductase|nr:hypothetical protein [Actinomycetota bacterium]
MVAPSNMHHLTTGPVPGLAEPAEAAMDQQVMRDIVEQAGRAPSIHNTQPWRFVAHGDALEVWTDPERGLDVLDPTGRARHLSCGAALLHARVAAAARGYETAVTLEPDPTQPEHLATLRVTEGAGRTAEDQRLADVISERRTTRAAFSTEPLAADVVAALQQAAHVEGCWLRLVETPDDAIAVAVLLARADELEKADPAYRDELHRWTGRGDKARDGIPAPAAESDESPRGSTFVLRDFVSDRDIAASSPSPEEPPPAEKPLVVVLGTRDDDVRSWLEAGQGLGRLLLTAASLGVAASPMTQPLEVPDTRARLTAELGLLGHPQMLLRLGYGGEGGGTETPRRPVQDILTQPDE